MYGMKKIVWIGLMSMLFGSGTLSAQSEYNVLSFTTDEMYNKYLLHTVYTQYDRRDSVFYTPLSQPQARPTGRPARRATWKFWAVCPSGRRSMPGLPPFMTWAISCWKIFFTKVRRGVT